MSNIDYSFPFFLHVWDCGSGPSKMHNPAGKFSHWALNQDYNKQDPSYCIHQFLGEICDFIFGA